MKIVPLRDRVLLRRDTIKEKTDGGLFLPDYSKERPSYATVEAIGPGIFSGKGEFTPTTLKIGDRILIEKYSGVDLKSIDDGLFLLPESQVLALLETVN